MDRRPPGIGTEKDEREEPSFDAELHPPGDPFTEAEWDRILPPIDENDPEWQAYERRMIQEALDDPHPSIPAEEVHRRILERHEARLKRESSY